MQFSCIKTLFNTAPLKSIFTCSIKPVTAEKLITKTITSPVGSKSTIGKKYAMPPKAASNKWKRPELPLTLVLNHDEFDAVSITKGNGG